MRSLDPSNAPSERVSLTAVKRVLEWIVSVPFILLFGLVLLVFDVVARVARLFGLRPFEHVMATLQRTLVWVYRLFGARIRVTKDPAVEPNTGYAIISNHQSLLDIAMIGGFLYSNFPKYVAKAELGKWIPSISLNLKHGGNALIDRSDRLQSVRAITEMAQTAQSRNVSVVIFPEGTRSQDGRLGDFRRAGSEALLRAAGKLPVVPAAIDGSWRLSRMLPFPLGAKVRIRFGAPIPRHDGDTAEVLETTRTFIESTLNEWRMTPNPA